MRKERSSYCLLEALAVGGDAPPKYVRVLPAEAVQGKKFKGVDGRGPFFVRDVQKLIANSTGGAHPRKFNYDHSSFSNAITRGTRAAAWIKEFTAKEDGIYALVEWTAGGKEAVLGGEYRFVSPEIMLAKDGEILAIKDVALTNEPALNSLALASDNQETETLMDLKKLAQALGLPDDADEQAILTAIADLKAKLDASAQAAKKETEGKAALADTSKDEAIKTLQAQLNQMMADSIAKEARSKVDAALSAGKIAPASENWALDYAKKDPAGFDAFVAAQPTLHLGKETALNAAKSAAAGFTSHADETVGRQFGLSAEDLKKGA